MVNLTLLHSSWRFYKRHPAQLGLSVLGILLGVAIVTAVIVTNSSSRRAFELAAQSVTGSTTHQIVSAEFGVPQNYYAHLRRQYNFPMAPVIEGYLSVDGELFTLLGIDPFADAGPTQNNFSLVSDDADTLLSQQASVLVSERTAQRFSMLDSSSFSADINGSIKSIAIAGIYRSENPAATEGLLLADIAVAQSLLGRGEFIDRIDLELADGQAQKLAANLPTHLRLVSSSKKADTMADMTRGFQINLTAMSLLALLVGAFLIHNTMTFSVLQRRELFATLRIVGFTASGVFRSILYEALAISLFGSVLGIIAGYWIAHYLIKLTTLTINDLYFVLHIQQVWMTPLLAASLILLGIVTSLIAASASAAEAASLSPLQARSRSRLEARASQALPILALVGIGLMILGCTLAFWPTQSLFVGFAALMALVMGYGFVLPWLVGRAITCLRGSNKVTGNTGRLHTAWSSNLLLSFSVGAIQRSISRTGIAIAALCIAVSATFGVDIMIDSFRATVSTWLARTLQSDIYVTVPSSASARADGVLDTDLHARITALDFVADWSSGRTRNVITQVGDLNMLVLKPHADGANSYDFHSANVDKIWQDFLHDDSVLISEPLANKHNLSRGDLITLFTSRHGDLAFKIAGVYKDYGSSHGRLTMARAVHDRHWDDRSISTIGLKLKADASIDGALDRLRTLARSMHQQWIIRSNLEIRERSLEIFDRTFQVTRVLRYLTIGVAFIGIFSALLALQMERAKEFAVLRASGATSEQIAMIVILQTVLMGGFAGLLALPLGWMMSEVLISVINQRSFGWSMQSLIPRGSMVTALGLALTSACLAGIYPAYRMSKQPISNQLRDE